MFTRQSSSSRGRWPLKLLVVAGVVLVILIHRYVSREQESGQGTVAAPQVKDEAPVNPLDRALMPPGEGALKDGVAVALLIDTSGSMNEQVADADRSQKPKILIAREAAVSVLRQCDRFAREHPERVLQVGVYEFSARDRQESCRPVIDLGPLALSAAEASVNRMSAEGGTPIGDAMIRAQRDLYSTGLSRLHILVVTDGENNRGYNPADVAAAISRLPAERRSSVYVIAFDVAADRFNAVRDAGGLILQATAERELLTALDYVLTGKILVEQPEAPPAR